MIYLYAVFLRCLDMDATNQPSIEYMKQLLLSSVRKIVDDILKSSQKGNVLFIVDKMISKCDATCSAP